MNKGLTGTRKLSLHTGEIYVYLEYFYNSHLNELGYINYLSLEVVKATQEQVTKPQKLETLSDDIGSASSI